MSDASFGLSRVGQIAVVAKDLARATAFYRDVLGMCLLFEYPGMAFFDCDGVRIYLTAPHDSAAHGTSLLYYTVEDIDMAHETLVGRGVAFLQEPQMVHEDARQELWLAFFQDSEGNTLALMQEREKDAA